MIMALVLFLVAGAIYINREKMPWAVSACKAYEPCKIQYGEFETMMIPVPSQATAAAAVSNTTITSAGDPAITVKVPMNTSATTLDGEALTVSNTAPVAQ